MPHPIACQAYVLVAGVFSPGLPATPQKLFNFRTPYSQQRPHNPFFEIVILGGAKDLLLVSRGVTSNHRRNPTQPFRPRPAEQLHHHCLGLIVECVPRRYDIRLQSQQRCIAQLTCSLFQTFTFKRLPFFYIHIELPVRNSQPFAKFPHKRSIRIGFRATQTVVNMGYAQHHSQRFFVLSTCGICLQQPQQQRH